MIYYDRLGLEPKEWISIVASKYNVSQDAIRRDWSARKKWMQIFFKVKDAKDMALDMLLDYEIALRDAMKLYEEAKDVKIKTQTLWLRLKVIERKNSFLEKLGAFRCTQIDYNSSASLYAESTIFP